MNADDYISKITANLQAAEKAVAVAQKRLAILHDTLSETAAAYQTQTGSSGPIIAAAVAPKD